MTTGMQRRVEDDSGGTEAEALREHEVSSDEQFTSSEERS